MTDGVTQFLDVLLQCGTTPEGVATALGYRLVVSEDAPRAFLISHEEPKSVWVKAQDYATRANAWAACVRLVELLLEWQLTARARAEVLERVLTLQPKYAARYVTKTGT